MVLLLKSRIYVMDVTPNELRDNEANLPGVPPLRA